MKKIIQTLINNIKYNINLYKHFQYIKGQISMLDRRLDGSDDFYTQSKLMEFNY